jgi:hypothetical protein
MGGYLRLEGPKNEEGSIPWKYDGTRVSFWIYLSLTMSF